MTDTLGLNHGAPELGPKGGRGGHSFGTGGPSGHRRSHACLDDLSLNSLACAAYAADAISVGMAIPFPGELSHSRSVAAAYMTDGKKQHSLHQVI